jgi:hypothetical protein
MRWTPALACFSLAFGSAPLGQQDAPPVITVGGQSFATWQDYVNSQLFLVQGLRCGTGSLDLDAEQATSDCSLSSTWIKNRYAPEGHALLRIPVVVHILQASTGEGQISDATVQSQIDVLNEDLRAQPGTPGEHGTDARIEFFLADVDPAGNPTTGITRTTSDEWFNDGGDYYEVLAWDTHRYLNIYTNRASGTLGYVQGLPQSGTVGANADRVVILWAAFGRNAPIGPPFDLGRTATHEVGHYLGLYHPFDFGCGSAAECYTSGDRICDTNPEAEPVYGCPTSSSSCGLEDPFRNYMDYSDDACYQEFTPEQINRMRCTLENWRPELPRCVTLAETTVRNAGANLAVYTATPPVLGGSTTISIVAPAYTTAIVEGHAAALSVRLARGNYLLVDTASPRHFQITLTLPSSPVSMLIPNKASLCGVVTYSQAILLGGPQYALTNAVDMIVGKE